MNRPCLDLVTLTDDVTAASAVVYATMTDRDRAIREHRNADRHTAALFDAKAHERRSVAALESI